MKLGVHIMPPCHLTFIFFLFPTIYKTNMAAYANLWGETTTKYELSKFWAIAEVWKIWMFLIS